MARSLSTTAVVALSLLAGLGLGVPAGVLLSDEVRAVERRLQHERRRAALRARRAADTARWRRDSILWDSMGRLHAAREYPREVGRAQIFTHCAVSYVVRGTDSGGLQLFSAYAREWDDSTTVSRGYTYRPGGFTVGDTVIVVLPDVTCGAPIVLGFSVARVQPHAPITVEKR